MEEGFDLAIRVGRAPDSSLRALLLGRVPVRLVASPSYLRARGAPARPRELARHDCIAVGPHPGPAEWTFYRRGRRERVTVDPALQTTSPTLAAQAATSGLGIVRTTEWLVRDEVRRGALVEVMGGWSCDRPERGGVPVYVGYAQAASASPPRRSRAFVELLKSIVAEEVARRPPRGD